MRPRKSSLPSLSDAQQTIRLARRQPARRIAAYTVLATFIGVFLVLGFGHGYTKAWEQLEVKGQYRLLHSMILCPVSLDLPEMHADVLLPVLANARLQRVVIRPLIRENHHSHNGWSRNP
jgi:hypothetical protein